MKRLLSVLCAMMLAVVTISLPVSADANTAFGDISGLLVRSLGNEDFPSRSNLSAKAMRTELDDLTDYAVAAGYNAIFFEVRPEGDSLYSSTVFPKSRYLVKNQGDFTFFDPLKEMLKAASGKGLSVYAVVDPYYIGSDLTLLDNSHPAVRDPSLAAAVGDGYYLNPASNDTVRLNAGDIARIARSYKVAGIVLRGLTFTDELEERAAVLVENVAAAVAGRTAIGVMLEDGDTGSLSGIVAHADLVLPVIRSETGLAQDSYQNRLKEWTTLSENRRLIPFIDTVQAGVQSPLAPEQFPAQIFAAKQAGISSFAAGNYRALAYGDSFSGSLLASMTNPTSASMVDLAYSPAQALSITRPTATINTSFTTYFIMGTSNPALPLTVDGKQIERNTPDGVFGTQVKLAMGVNTFTFRQGNQSETVTIRRTDGSVTPATISDIRSMYPVSSAVIQNGQTLSIRCVAPSGSSVTASIGGVSAVLKQSEAAKTGIPAVFTGTVTLSGAAAGAVENRGPITYRLSDGQSFSSIGNVFLTGDGARPMLRVTDHVSSVFPDDSVTEGDYKSVYKAGTMEEIAGQMGEYYKLASGAYIKKATVEVLAADSPALPQIRRITARAEGRVEEFVLEGAPGLPYWIEDLEGATRVTFYGDLTLPKEIDTSGTLFSSVVWVQNDDGSITATMQHTDSSKVWAVDVLNSEKDTILYARRAPSLSETVGRPLENVSVVLDPGHGGSDPGALSVLGMKGPFEKQLNLANALALKMRLEQLGATVILTREGDESLTLYERMAVSQKMLPDFYLSLHHNSVAESVDAYQQSGVESYYYDSASALFGETLVRHIANTNYARGYRFSNWGYYTVTRMRYAHSALCEIAFIPNPVEFRYACDSVEIYKTANAIASAIREVVAAASVT